MLVFPNAKINLGLNVVEKRPDGFHNIASCFYPVNWQEALEVVPADTLKFASSGIEIPGNPASNLCVKAFELLAEDFELSPVHMHLHKLLPIGAGLGGGSADCAFAIKALNELFGLGLSSLQQQAYAGKLGSDCPFFIENKPVWVTGKGEIFEPIDLDLSGTYIVLAYPGIHVRTAEAYAGIVPSYPEVSAKDLLEGDRQHWKASLHNDFEDSILPKYPAIAALKEYFYEKGAWYASMTGSGSTVFGLFDAEPEVEFAEGVTVWKGLL